MEDLFLYNCLQTPLYCAASLGHKDIAVLLLDAGSDPNTTNVTGRYFRLLIRFRFEDFFNMKGFAILPKRIAPL